MIVVIVCGNLVLIFPFFHFELSMFICPNLAVEHVLLCFIDTRDSHSVIHVHSRKSAIYHFLHVKTCYITCQDNLKRGCSVAGMARPAS